MQNQEATTVAKSSVDCWVSRFGCPANFHSDKGTNFMSNLLKIMCKELTNGTIEDNLAKYVGEQNTWSEYLQLIMTAYRSSVHTVTENTIIFRLVLLVRFLLIACTKHSKVKCLQPQVTTLET